MKLVTGHIAKAFVSNFLLGMGSALVLFPSDTTFSVSTESDAEKLRGDWEMVFGDLTRASQTFAEESKFEQE